MLAALHESLTAQRQLVADASHELRTPLTSLTTNLDLLEDGAGLADPQAPALVRAAREQAGELDQLIADLVDLARYHESTRTAKPCAWTCSPTRRYAACDSACPMPPSRPSCIRAWWMSILLRSITRSATWSTTPSNGRRPTPRCAWSSRRPGVGHRSRPGHRGRGPPPDLRTLLPGARRARHARRRARTSHRRRRRAGQQRHRRGADTCIGLHHLSLAPPFRRSCLFGQPSG